MVELQFGDRLTEQIRRKASQVVVGLDPRVERIPRELTEAAVAAHGETPRAAGEAVVAFNRAVIDAVAQEAVAVKCQVAFYEQYGTEGLRAYGATLAYARHRELLVFGDAKRNDIGSTAEAYARAHLGAAEPGRAFSEEFVVDAVTVNPYLGCDGVEPFLETAVATGRGVFALVKTSNPSSVDIQDLRCEGGRVYEHVARLVDRWGEPYRGSSGYSLLGAVVGATFPEELAALRKLMPHTPFLVPGFGAQGGGVEDVEAAFDSEGLGAVVNSSRGIIFAWERSPYREQYGAEGWREAVRAAAADMRKALWQATH